jgi:hypothetical protein
MAKTLLAACATAALLSGGPFGGRAAAMMLPAPVGAVPTMLTATANVCGISGCAQVRVSRVRHPPRGFVLRAVPMTVPAANSPQVSATNK